MEDVFVPVVRTLREIFHMLAITWQGHGSGLPMGYQQENLVMTGIGSGTKLVDIVVPLLVGIVTAGAYTQVLEAIGYKVARVTNVGGGYLKRIAATKAKGQDPSEIQRKYNLKLENFAASFTEAAFYSVDIFIAYRIFWHSSWCWPSNWLSVEDGALSDGRVSAIPDVPPYHAPREMRAFYVIEFGFYFSQLISVLTKHKKKDFLQMFFHHILTSMLIALSYSIGFLRIGIIVMICHSTFDPFLNGAKCFHYMFSKRSAWHVLADINFALATIAFFLCRFLLYPYAIFSTVNPELPSRLDISVSTPTENLLRLMLSLLLPIHIFWFYLILNVLLGALGGGTVQGDARSDDDDDDDEDAASRGEKKDN